jgi:mono/diheme cytochrome c family protein
MLYGSLPGRPDYITTVFLFAGIVSAAILLWVIFYGGSKDLPLNIKIALPVLMLILVSMLLSRQSIQDRSLLPLQKQLEASAIAYGNDLKPFEQQALGAYGESVKVVYDNGETIYSRSCSFCHGVKGDGRGMEAKGLTIPPEDISAIRTTRGYLHTILAGGISGSAMPYFTFFDRYKLDSLIDYLDKKNRVLSLPDPPPVKISKTIFQQAAKVYDETCSACHGKDGRGSALSKGLQPPPPDLTVYSLSPERALDVITNGYPGTAMSSFASLKTNVRWGLVMIVNEKRSQ